MEQTEGDIEIILVDDGSTDGSGALCDALVKEDARIRVIHKVNGGLSSARNAGVSAAQGEYILLLDGDDRLHREAVSRTLAAAEQTGADFVQFCYREVSNDAQPLELPERKPAVVEREPTALFENLYRLGGMGASGCTKLFRRELLEKIPFENVRHEDEMWCTRAFRQPLKAAYIDDVLYDYVMRSGSLIRGAFNSSRLDIIQVCEARMEVLKELDLSHLLEREYGKLFLSVLTLYRDAVNAGDKLSAAAVRTAFQKHKAGIRTYAKPNGKFGLLFCLMYVWFDAAQLYRFYWKIRR